MVMDAVVAVGRRPSMHAAAQACEDLPVSIQALYDKIRRTEPNLVQALVAGSAERLSTILAPMQQDRAPIVPDYRLRIVDGNHLPARSATQASARSQAAEEKRIGRRRSRAPSCVHGTRAQRRDCYPRPFKGWL